MVIVMFALSLTIYEIFANQEKLQNLDLENEGQDQEVEERNLWHSIECSNPSRWISSEF